MVKLVRRTCCRLAAGALLIGAAAGWGAAVAAAADVGRSSGQTVYVPVYSHIYFGDGKPYLLTTTLAIRNADLARSIIIKSVKYYDTNGKLVRSYLADPLKLDALVSREILVEEHDTAGGSGAKFIIEWTSEEDVEPPPIEAVMSVPRISEESPLPPRGIQY